MYKAPSQEEAVGIIWQCPQGSLAPFDIFIHIIKGSTIITEVNPDVLR